MSEQKNIIKKLDVEINTNSMEHALHLKDHISDFIMTKIYPQLEKYFDEIQMPESDKVYRIDDLFLEFNIETNTLLNSYNILLLNKLENLYISDLLREKNTSEIKIEVYPSEEIPGRSTLYFLRNGTLPWWDRKVEIFSEKTLKNLFENPKLRLELEEILGRNIFRKRLVFQAPEKAFYYIVNRLLKEGKYDVNFDDIPIKMDSFLIESEKIRELLLDHALRTSSPTHVTLMANLVAVMRTSGKDPSISIEQSILQTLFAARLVNALYDKKEAVKIHFGEAPGCYIAFSPEELKTIDRYNLKEKISKITTDVDLSSDVPVSMHYGNIEIESRKSSSTGAEQHQEIIEDNQLWEEELQRLNKVEDGENGLLIANVGLILLHPFLKMFFKNVGVGDGSTIRKDKQDKAVHLLHYLACGRLQPSEHELSFEKYLCDIPMEFPLRKEIHLSEKEKEACEELLQAVLGHWDALKSKSSHLLRNEFLSREGKLVVGGDNDKLFIERKTMDILLEKLPWNIGIVQLPWKEKMMSVQW